MIAPPIEPMLAKLEDDLPVGTVWRYEPKWDGFRAMVFRGPEGVRIQSRKLQPLEPYFPELVESLEEALADPCVVDGEIVVEGPSGTDFDALLLRIHPAASRIARLSRELPASFVAFDLLAIGEEDLRGRPFSDRRGRLEQLLRPSPRVWITEETENLDAAREWFAGEAGVDGVVAKRADLPYQPGERAMVKVKHLRTVDCVVGGFREEKRGGVASLLLGLYDAEGVLQYVGHAAAFSAPLRRELRELLRPLEGGESFGGGRSPGGPSRWAHARDTEWTPVRPRLVCEVSFDRMQGERFRHAAKFLRWRPDKPAAQCTFEQLART